MKNASKKELSESQKITVFLLKSFILLGLTFQAISLIFRMNSNLPPMEFDQIITEPADQTQFVIEEDFDGPSVPGLKEFYPLRASPYIFVQFDNDPSSQSLSKVRHKSSAIINYKSGKQELRVNWSYDTRNVSMHRENYSFHKDLGGTLIGDDPHVLIWRKERILPDYLKRFSFLPVRTFYDPEEEIWAISPDGKPENIYSAQHMYFDHQPSLLLPDRRLQTLHDSIETYQLSHNSFKKTKRWTVERNTLFALSNGDYLITQIPNQDDYHFRLLRHEEPDTIKIGFNQHIKPLILNYDSETKQKFIENSKETIVSPNGRIHDRYPEYSYNLIPLFSYNNDKVFAVLNIPGEPLFEINLKTITAEMPQEAIRLLGYLNNNEWLHPVFVFDDQKKILMSFGLSGKQDFNRSYYLARMFAIVDIENLPQRPDEHLKPIHWYTLPNQVNKISRIPLDEDHMLGFGRTTFWKIRMDGGGIEALFPKAGEELTYYNREARKMESFQGGSLREYVPDE